MQFLDRMNPQTLTGLTPGQSSGATSMMPGIGRSAGPASSDSPSPFHPDNPLFWFGAIAAVTLGFIAVNTSIRVGPFKAGASAGK